MQQTAANFQAAFAAALVLPARLAQAFTPDRCLSAKEESQAWLLRRRTDGAPFFLRTGPIQDLTEEFRLLCRASEVLPGRVPWPVDCFEENGTGYLLRSWMPGQTLEQWRAARGRCSERDCASMGMQLCALLEKLHRLDPPVIHRDIKPENLVVGPGGELGLIDFGIARQYRQGKDRDTKRLGTEGTAAPEQYGFAQTDARTDLYGLGMTLLWLYTGSYDREALDRVPPRLRHTLERATDFSPDRRYGSVAEFGRALAGKRTWKRVLASAAALLAALAIVMAFVLQQRSMDALRTRLDETQAQLTALEEAQAQADREAAARAEEVVFASQTLEAAVRAELDRPDGPITREDLLSVERLAVAGETVFGREQSFSYMGAALLDGQMLPNEVQGDVRDLSLLADMPNLKTLILCNQPLTDLSPLEGLGLEVLVLGGCAVEDFAVLGSLPNLRELLLDTGTTGLIQVKGLEALAGLPLTKLSLHGVNTADWSFLSALDQVRSLSLRDAPPEALEALPGMDCLQELDISNYPGSDLTALALPKLNTLTLRVSTMSLTGAEQLTGLQTFALVLCTTQDLSPLAALPQLIYINLDGPALDYSQLNDLTGLLYVRVPAEYRENVEAACPGHAFQILTY